MPSRRRHRFGSSKRLSYGDRSAGLVVVLGLRSPYLNLVSHGDQMTASEEAEGAYAHPTKCANDKVCLLAYCARETPRWNTLLVVEQGMKSVAGRGHTVGHLHVSPGTAEFRSSKAHVVQHTASHRHCKRHVCVLQLGGCRRCGATCVSLHLVWYVIS